MILEVTNHLLGFVPGVHVQLDQLEFCPPGLGNDPFDVCAGLLISQVMMTLKPGIQLFIRLC